jgi:hypothetical protein
MATSVRSISGSNGVAGSAAARNEAGSKEQRSDRKPPRVVSLEPTTRRFLALARDRFSELERAAALAAEQLDTELVGAVDDLYKRDRIEAQRLAILGESLVEHQRTVAERSGHMRRRLERRGGLPPSPALTGRRSTDTPPPEATEAPADEPKLDPPEGVVLLVRQMVTTGADERKIGRVLKRLGVEDADEKVKLALR